MRILILEDSTDRVEQFKRNIGQRHMLSITSSSRQAIDLLKNNKWDLLCLDHDLGGRVFVPSGEDTGYEVATFLEINPEFMPTNIIVHSLNPVGAKNILSVLKGARQVPFAWTKSLEEILKS